MLESGQQSLKMMRSGLAASRMPRAVAWSSSVLANSFFVSYGIQWFLFTGVAVVGWWIFVRKEAEESTDEHGKIPDRATELPDSVRLG